jgi:predicted permease
MSPRRRDHEENKHKRVDIDMEEVAHFVNIISICSGALLIVSLITFLLTGSQPETDVIYLLVIGINSIAFIAGRLFVKKFGNKE